MRLFKMHVGLYQYIKTEIKKPRNKKETKEFWLGIIRAYFSAWKNEITLLIKIFDKDYQLKKKEYEKFQKAKKEIAGLIKLLRYSKEKLRKAGISRQRIRRFFIGLGSTDDEALQILCDDLIKEIGG